MTNPKRFTYLFFAAEFESMTFRFARLRLIRWYYLSSSGEPADVGPECERSGGADGLCSAPLSHGRVGRLWIGPNPEHTAVEVSPGVGLGQGVGLGVGSQRRLQKLQTVQPRPPPPTPGPSSSQTSLQNMSVFSSLSLFLSIVRVNWEFYRISAWQFLPVVWVFGFMTFIFLFWKKLQEKKIKTAPTSTYR